MSVRLRDVVAFAFAMRCLAAAGVFAVFGHLPVSSRAADSPWQEIAPLPAGTAGFARGVAEGGPIVAGGNRWEGDSKITLDEVWGYQADANQWKPHMHLPRPFSFGAHGSHQGALHLLGGDDGSMTRADLMVMSPSERAADSIHGLPQPVAYAGSTVSAGILYVLGGTEDVRAPLAMHAQFFGLNLVTREGLRLPSYPGGPVIHAALAAVGERIFAFTGGRLEGSPPLLVNSDQAWRFDPRDRSWTALNPYPFPVRGLAACPVDDRYILLAGGYRNSPFSGSQGAFTDQCYLYDVQDDRYHPLPPLPHAAMLVGLVRHGDFLYALGGEDRPRHRVSQGYRASVFSLMIAAGVDVHGPESAKRTMEHWRTSSGAK